MSNDSLPLILIYYNFRGQVQPIRNLFCYLSLPFIEIHMDRIEEQKKLLSPAILQHVKKFKIDKSHLPALIHQGLLVEGPHPIMTYTCMKFNRADLLGSDIKVKSRLHEILQIYFVKQPQSMMALLELSEKAVGNSSEMINSEARSAYELTFNNSKYIRQICQYLDKQQNPSFVFGDLTLIDFFFFETCIYINGIHNHQDRVDFKLLQQWNPLNTHFLEKPNPYYMLIVQDYERRMRNSQWYMAHKQYLESFSIISPIVSCEKAEGLRKIWVGSEKLVA